jgi:hypothetical protein
MRRILAVVFALCACHQQDQEPPAGMGELCGPSRLPDSGSNDSQPPEDDCPPGLVCVETKDTFEKPLSFCTIPCTSENDCRFNGCNYGCSPDGYCGVLFCY